MEDGDAAQRTTQPFGIVFFEFGIDGLQEGSNEGLLKDRAYDAAFVQEVHDYQRQGMSEVNCHLS